MSNTRNIKPINGNGNNSRKFGYASKMHRDVLVRKNEGLFKENEDLFKENKKLTKENEKLTKENEGLFKENEELNTKNSTLNAFYGKGIEEKLKTIKYLEQSIKDEKYKTDNIKQKLEISSQLTKTLNELLRIRV